MRMTTFTAAIVAVLSGCGNQNTVNIEGDETTVYTVDSAGGTAGDDGVFRLFFEAGAVDDTTEVTVARAEDGDVPAPCEEDGCALSPVFHVTAEPSVSEFGRTVEAVLWFTEGAVDPGLRVEILHYDGARWAPLPSAQTETKVSGQTVRLGHFVAVRGVECDRAVMPGGGGCWADGAFCACGESGGLLAGTWEIDYGPRDEGGSCEVVEEGWCHDLETLSESFEPSVGQTLEFGEGELTIAIDAVRTRDYRCSGVDDVPCDPEGEQYRSCCADNMDGTYTCTEENESGRIPYEVDGAVVVLGGESRFAFCVDGDDLKLFGLAAGEFIHATRAR